MIKIKSALISVFEKEGLELILEELKKLNIQIFSTGGTQKFITDKGYKSTPVEELTQYPSIFGGRVKTLHPKIFGGILARRDKDEKEIAEYDIPLFDLVITDLYPFTQTVAMGSSHEEIIEKIDIGGISLIRAGAKNYRDVLVISSRTQYPELIEILRDYKGETSLEARKTFASHAFAISSGYDESIHEYLRDGSGPGIKIVLEDGRELRYGENPHQKGTYYGHLDNLFDQLNGKEISYNNIVDMDAAVSILSEFEETAFVVIKHTNPCGVAETGGTVGEAWKKALAGDPVSVFGGILATNKTIDEKTAGEINKLFFEVLIAPHYEDEALKILKSKKNRIILKQNLPVLPKKDVKAVLNGYLVQETDDFTETEKDLKTVTELEPTHSQVKDMLFANKIVKHAKSNAIVLVKDRQLIGIGMGQTSRIDALKQAIHKAKAFNFILEGAVMASDAFFPFADSVEMAQNEGIKAVIQPGGSVKDQDSINYCNNNKMAMVFTGHRHFKH